jgi:hypothetical protein
MNISANQPVTLDCSSILRFGPRGSPRVASETPHEEKALDVSPPSQSEFLLQWFLDYLNDVLQKHLGSQFLQLIHPAPGTTFQFHPSPGRNCRGIQLDNLRGRNSQNVFFSADG